MMHTVVAQLQVEVEVVVQEIEEMDQLVEILEDLVEMNEWV
jgi:hypothetical protein